MFRLVKEAQAPWPVTFDLVDESGRIVRQTVTLRLVRVGVEEFNALFADQAPVDPAAAPAQNLSIFSRVVRGWDVLGEDGRPLPFEPANMALLLDFPGFAAAFGQAYVRFWMAIPEEREKNSGPSPAGGPAEAAETAGAQTTAPA